MGGQRKWSHIYAIRAGDHVKIGRANNVRARLDTLQTSSAHEMVVVGYVRVPVEHVARLEKEIHRALEDFHVRGEWFQVADALVLFEMKQAADAPAETLEVRRRNRETAADRAFRERSEQIRAEKEAYMRWRAGSPHRRTTRDWEYQRMCRQQGTDNPLTWRERVGEAA